MRPRFGGAEKRLIGLVVLETGQRALYRRAVEIADQQALHAAAGLF